MKRATAFGLIVLGAATFGFAQEVSEEGAIGPLVHAPANKDHEPELAYSHPRLSEDGRWAGVFSFIVVPAFFLAAAMIGALVYSEMPEERPDTAHSHDEPPGASHHHGPGGTVQPGPEHELPGGHAEHH